MGAKSSINLGISSGLIIFSEGLLTSGFIFDVGGIIGLTVPADDVDSGESDLDHVSATWAFKFSKLGDVKNIIKEKDVVINPFKIII